jgi:hypothetical protein
MVIKVVMNHYLVKGEAEELAAGESGGGDQGIESRALAGGISPVERAGPPGARRLRTVSQPTPT